MRSVQGWLATIQLIGGLVGWAMWRPPDRSPPVARRPAADVPVETYVFIHDSPPVEPDPPDPLPSLRVLGFLDDLVLLECGSVQFWMAAGESLHTALIGRASPDVLLAAHGWRLARFVRDERRVVFERSN